MENIQDFDEIIELPFAGETIQYGNWHKLKDKMKLFKGEKATFIYGDLDPSYKYMEMLTLIGNEKVTWQIIPSADHHFKGKLEEFMNLPYKFLL